MHKHDSCLNELATEFASEEMPPLGAEQIIEEITPRRHGPYRYFGALTMSYLSVYTPFYNPGVMEVQSQVSSACSCGGFCEKCAGLAAAIVGAVSFGHKVGDLGHKIADRFRPTSPANEEHAL